MKNQRRARPHHRAAEPMPQAVKTELGSTPDQVFQKSEWTGLSALRRLGLALALEREAAEIRQTVVALECKWIHLSVANRLWLAGELERKASVVRLTLVEPVSDCPNTVELGDSFAV